MDMLINYGKDNYRIEGTETGQYIIYKNGVQVRDSWFMFRHNTITDALTAIGQSIESQEEQIEGLIETIDIYLKDRDFTEYLRRKLSVSLDQWDGGDADQETDYLGFKAYFLDQVLGDLEVAVENDRSIGSYIEVIKQLL